MDGWVYAVGAFAALLAYGEWRHRQEDVALFKAEATEKPSLGDKTADKWSRLDQISLEIARHEKLADWFERGRPIVRDIPVRDRQIEGGWDVCVEDWGDGIADRSGAIFHVLRPMQHRDREKRLALAKIASQSARKALAARAVLDGDGMLHQWPSWMTPDREK